MQFKTMIAVLLVSLLIFGCTSPTQGAPQGQPSGGPGASPMQPANQTVGNESAPNNPAPAANVSGPSGGDLVGKTFEQLAALGVPIQCDITTSSGTAKLYKGTGNDMRTEMTASSGLCSGQKMIFIIKGDKYYMGCEQGPIMPGSACQWLVFNATGNAGAPPVEKPDYSNVPAAQISCVPWVPDPSMLQAPDNACSLQDLIPTG